MLKAVKKSLLHKKKSREEEESSKVRELEKHNERRKKCRAVNLSKTLFHKLSYKASCRNSCMLFPWNFVSYTHVVRLERRRRKRKDRKNMKKYALFNVCLCCCCSSSLVWNVWTMGIRTRRREGFNTNLCLVTGW